MNDEISTEKVRQIIRRWCRYLAYWMLLGCVLVGCIMGYLGAIVPPKQFLLRLCLTGLGMLCFLLNILFLHSRSRRFAQKLSVEERTLLTEIAKKGDTDQPHVVKILLKAADINPQSELLRPSMKKDDKTLLRAATYADETAEKQLLRPTQNDPVP